MEVMTGKHRIDQNGKIDWESTIASCGLIITRKPLPEEARDPNTAILAATRGNVRPTATVDIKDANSMNTLDTLDTLWDTIAKPLITPRPGEFLIILWGKGSMRDGWFRVQDSLTSRLPSRICEAIGRPEFLALSLNGRDFCAVTVEEDDYWVVTHTYEVNDNRANCPDADGLRFDDPLDHLSRDERRALVTDFPAFLRRLDSLWESGSSSSLADVTL